MNSNSYKVKDIKKLFGIDKNKLFYWIHTYGLLKPEIEKASGTGTKTKFSLKNLLELAVLREMLDFGFDLKTTRTIKMRIDSYKENDENIYNAIIKDKNRDCRVLFIYKSGAKISLYVSSPAEEAVDMNSGPILSPDLSLWNLDKDRRRPPSYTGVIIQIGMIASELIEKIKKD